MRYLISNVFIFMNILNMTILLSYSPDSDDLHLRVIDSLTSSNKCRSSRELLGKVNLRISDLVKRDGMEYKLQVLE